VPFGRRHKGKPSGHLTDAVVKYCVLNFVRQKYVGLGFETCY